jgi:predicted transposase YbfD/YdcC
VAGVPSLPLVRVNAARLLRLVQDHWHIENKAHWVRDVTFEEDRTQVRCGNLPQVLAPLTEGYRYHVVQSSDGGVE